MIYINDSKLIEKLNEYIKKDNLNHAYLIETNSEDRRHIADLTIDLICDFFNTSKERLLEYDDIEYISNDDKPIKKDQILSLKSKLSTKSINNSFRVYVIENAEDLNSSSANTLLKFLEEPESNIYAILLTDNKNKVINTIVSRCFNIKVFIPKNEIKPLEDKSIIDFLNIVTSKQIKAIAYVNIYFGDVINDRDMANHFAYFDNAKQDMIEKVEELAKSLNTSTNDVIKFIVFDYFE